MPFILCKSERRRIDELVDHVKDLSDTIEDLRAEVEAIKISTNIASNESLNEKRNRAECSTLHKLKRCLQKNLIPAFSRNPTYKMRKKCQQMFSQMPTIIPRSSNLPDNKHQQVFPSSPYAKTDSHPKKPKSDQTKYLDEAEAKIITRPANLPDNKHQQHFPSSPYAKTDSHPKKPKSAQTKYLDEAEAKIITRPANLPDNKHQRHFPSSSNPKTESHSKKPKSAHTQTLDEDEAKIITRPANLPDNKHQQHFPSSSNPKTESHSKKSKSAHTKYLDEAEAKRRNQNKPTSSQRRKNITNDSPKAKHLEISSSSTQSSKGSLNEPHRVYDSFCTYDTCNSLKTSRKNEHLGKRQRDTAKKNTADAATATTTSSPKKVTPKQRLIDSETIQRQRSVTFINRKKNIPLEKDSMISSLSSSNIDYNVAPAKPKTDLNTKRTVNSAPGGPEVKKKIKKISRSTQCSIDSEYLKKPPVNPKNVYTNTHAYNLSPYNKNIAAQTPIDSGRKSLASKSTQTSSKLWSKYRGEMCANDRRRYCPKAKRRCFSAGSQSSLTSCSPRSISSFCLGTEELGEGLMYQYYKREPNPQKEKIEKEKNTKIREEEADKVKKTRLFSSREPEKKDAKAIKMKPRNRRKRTYSISSDVLVKKSDETGQCNLDEEPANSSSDGMSTFQESELQQRKIAKKWKKSEGLPKVSEGHQLRRKQQSSPDQHDYYTDTSVYTNSQTDRFVPKLKRRSNWTVQEKHKKPTRLSKLRENTSSSSCACTDETCSLTSDPQISRSDSGSVNSERFNKNKKVTKHFNNTFAHL